MNLHHAPFHVRCLCLWITHTSSTGAAIGIIPTGGPKGRRSDYSPTPSSFPFRYVMLCNATITGCCGPRELSSRERPCFSVCKSPLLSVKMVRTIAHSVQRRDEDVPRPKPVQTTGGVDKHCDVSVYALMRVPPKNKNHAEASRRLIIYIRSLGSNSTTLSPITLTPPF
jgi:hypothetical protein